MIPESYPRKPAGDVSSMAQWLSSILRWSLGLLMIGIAWYYEDAEVLYVFGALVFLTGFLRPKRCTAESCER